MSGAAPNVIMGGGRIVPQLKSAGGHSVPGELARAAFDRLTAG